MIFFKRGEWKTLWPFYIDSLISPLLFFAPAFYIIYFAGLNLSFFQIGLLLSMAPLASLLFEIPTGAIADLYGRKLSVLTGYFLEAIIALLLFFFTNYYVILILFIMWGIASTLSSGAKDAWVVDLINKKDKKLLHSYFNKSQVFDNFALIISGILGAIFVKMFGVAIIWPATFVAFIISASILLLAKEYHIKEETNIKKAFKGLFKQTKKTVSYGYKHPVLFYFLLAGFLFVIAEVIGGAIAWVPFMQELGFPDYAFGYLWSLIAFVTMLAPLLSRKFLKEGKEKKFMIILLSLSAFVMLFVLLANTWLFALIIMLLAEFFVMAQYPASKMYFHRFIPSKLRATMGSIEMMISSIAAVIAPVIAGLLIDSIGARFTVFLYAPLMIPVIWVYAKMREKRLPAK